jgi:hypothetical protein
MSGTGAAEHLPIELTNVGLGIRLMFVVLRNGLLAAGGHVLGRDLLD